MILYHFTALYHLPPIRREGIRLGVVPVSRSKILNAPNLTNNPNPQSQNWSLGALIDKSKVRITITLPDGDERLESWRTASERLEIDRKWRRGLEQAASGQGKFWYLYWGTIPSAWFASIEIRKEDFQPHTADELDILCQKIDREREKIVIEKRPNGTTAAVAGLDSWLFDGIGRA